MQRNKLLLLLALLLMAVTGAWAQKGDTSWTSGDCTVTLSGGTLTISKTSGNGAMADYNGGYNSQPWADYKTQITSVVVQSGVTIIGKYSFFQFTNIQSVSLPAGLQTIGEAAFRGITNTNFTSVTIPSSVTTFGNNAFDGCNKLTSVTLPASLTNNGAGRYVFKGCTSLTSVTIPDGVESIGMNYFQNCTSLASITIPASVKNIGASAFDGCSSLTTVTINGSPYIPSNAFPAGATVTINLTAHQGETGEYWTTFHNYSLNFQTDAYTQVFKVALSGTALSMNKVANGIVDAGTAVVLKTTSENIAMTSTTSTSSDEQTNNLIGVTATAGKSSDGTFYVLDNGASGLGFYKLASGNKVGTGKAYLTSDSESDFFSIGGGSGSEEASTYTVSLKDGTEDADKWTIAPAEATTTGVDEGTEITATYSGNRRVKGVKAVKKGGAAPSGPVAINVTSPAVGQVIGSDGKNYAVGSLPSGVTAIALIAFVNQNNGYVIAVAMTDEEGTMGWEAAKEACTAHTPTVTGASWAMPSQEGGWYLLFNAFGGNSNSCTGLNTAIENAGGKALQNGNYWAKLNDAYPYPIGINNGTVTYSKDDSTNHEYRARAVLLINAGNGEVIGT